jgi:hypothetical protein
VDDPIAELAGYFRRKSRVPDQELVRLTATAREGGSRWDAIAAGCGVRDYHDITGVVGLPCWKADDTGAELLLSATQCAVEQLTGSQRRWPPLTWICPGCGRQVSDRAADGRPVHVEHGHAPGCARLARHQAAEDQRRREQIPGLILASEPAVGAMQRHWLRERIIDDCPRCGWRGYFHHYLATVDGDWAAAICDNCYADLHPDITVTVKFYAARLPPYDPGGGEAVAVIRQRDRSDHDYPDVGHFPDLGQQMTWRLWWEHTTMLVEEAHGGCDYDLAEISREEAGQIAAERAARFWPSDAALLPWVASVYPA